MKMVVKMSVFIYSFIYFCSLSTCDDTQDFMNEKLTWARRRHVLDNKEFSVQQVVMSNL